MATKGLSYMVAGKYAVSQGALSYTEGKVLGKAVSYTINLDEPTRNDLYGDNEVAESDTQIFTTGNIALNTTEFSPEVRAWMFGITAETVEVSSGNSVSVYNYDDDAAPIEFGVGFIEYKQVNNVDQWVARTLTRVKARMPGGSATTKGESIEWQTPTITCDIYRDETAKRKWQSETQYFDDEAKAKAYLNHVFGVSAS